MEKTTTATRTAGRADARDVGSHFGNYSAFVTAVAVNLFGSKVIRV
jgi:hypothetical protein